jgi:hypothetical protein
VADTVIASTANANMDDAPLWLQKTGADADITYTATLDRTLFDGTYTSEGVQGTTSFIVTQRGAGANFSVDVSAGFAVVTGDSVANQGKYMIRSIGVVNVAYAGGAPGSGTRVHRIIARIRDKVAAGSNYDWTLEWLEDTGTGTPAEPASAITLATVSITVAQASVTNANITDLRPYARMYGDPYKIHKTVTTATQPIIFSGIPSTFKQVEILFSAKSTANSSLDQMAFRVNNISTGIYHWMYNEIAGPAPANNVGLQSSQTSATVGHAPGMPAGVGTQYLTGRILFGGWDRTTANTDQLTWLGSSHQFRSTGDSRLWDVGGSCVTNPPWTEIRFLTLTASNFGVGSTFTLLGWD